MLLLAMLDKPSIHQCPLISEVFCGVQGVLCKLDEVGNKHVLSEEEVYKGAQYMALRYTGVKCNSWGVLVIDLVFQDYGS